MLIQKGDKVFVPMDGAGDSYALGTVKRFRVEVELSNGKLTLRTPDECYLVADKEVAVKCQPLNL